MAAAVFAAEPQHWAYPINVEKPIAPGADAPGAVQVPGSARSYTYAQIDDLMTPPDWFPESHAPAPNVVMKGAGKTVLACGACHLMSGMGHPESSHLAGLPKEYILRQLADFKRGTRKDPTRMNGIAKDLSDEDAEQAAAWFSALKPIIWTKVVETDTVREQVDWNPEFSRRARGFPTYAAIRQLGRDGIAAMIERCCQHARSIAIACCGGDLIPFRCASTATHGVQYSAMARPSKQAITPGCRAAFERSSFFTFACACGLRKNTT